MKRFTLALLCTALFAPSTGCIFVSSDDSEGSIEGTWQTALDGAVVPCDTTFVEVTTVRMTAVGTGGTYSADFACTGGGGTMAGVLEGTYDVTLEACDADGCHGSMIYRDIVVLDGATSFLTRDAVDVIFTFESPLPPLSRVYFSLDFGEAGGDNCAFNTTMDAGVKRIALGVVNRDTATCERHMFFIEAASTMGTSYCPIDEPGNTGTTCVGSATPIYVELPSGNYDLTFSGIVEEPVGTDVECYLGTQSGVVVGREDRDLQQLLIPVVNAAPCN